MTSDQNPLRPLLPRFGLPESASLRLLNRSENTTWIAGEGTPDATILRQHRQGYHSPQEVRSELAWLAALQGQADVRVVRPKGGTDVHFAGDQMVVGFHPITGQEPRPGDDLRPLFGQLGVITARLHRHARGWPRPAGFARKRWDCDTILGPAAHWGQWPAAPGLTGQGQQVIAQAARTVTNWLADYGTGPNRMGLIHGDLRLANLLMDATGLWVIDFDDCGFGWWMYDFAAAVSFMETDPRVPELAAIWEDGYASVTPLSAQDIAALPVLVLLRRILLTAWLGTRAGSDTAAEFGGPAFTEGTVALADRFMTHGPLRIWD